MAKIGILLTNTGTPDAPTSSAVRRYLKQFLSDKRIVQIPRIVWLPILYGLILPFRSSRSAKLYKSIWTEEGSPMRVGMSKVAEKLQNALSHQTEHEYIVRVGMNYGYPSIKEGLAHFETQQVDEIILLPLYPQYSNTTAAATMDQALPLLQNWKSLPSIRFIRDYASHPKYIEALATSVRETWATQETRYHLLISFHGIPKRFVAAGDIYQAHCEQTANALAQALQLRSDEWTLCYQSQFGYDKWLQPSTQTLFEQLPQQGIKRVNVICPGFSVDCLETLEEIAERGKESFLHAGGDSLHYIPALNDSQEQIDLLAALLLIK